MNKKVCMLLHEVYPDDIRVSKETKSLIKSGFEIHTLCLQRKKMNGKLIAEESPLRQNIQTENTNFSSFSVINMLNTKHLIIKPSSPQGVVKNDNALGAPCFVTELEYTQLPNGEFNQTLVLSTPSVKAVINKNEAPSNIGLSKGEIALTEYHSGYWKYESNNTGDGFAVFSEIHYPKGFEVTIDGEAVDMLRANYILRAVAVPAGNHAIEFKFVPKIYTVGSGIMQVFAILTCLVFLGAIYLSFKNQDI